jgi:hypothetical protein
MKIFPVITLPSLVSAARGPRRVLAIIFPLALVGILYLPFILGGGEPFGSILTFSAHWEANSSLFRIILAVVDDNQWAHLVSNALIAVWILFIASRRWPLVRRLYWSVMGFFLLASTVHPWYLAWVAIFLPLLPRWSGIAFVTLGNLAGITVIHYLQDGIWLQPLWALVVEYVPVYVLVAIELRRDFQDGGMWLRKMEANL